MNIVLFLFSAALFTLGIVLIVMAIVLLCQPLVMKKLIERNVSSARYYSELSVMTALFGVLPIVAVFAANAVVQLGIATGWALLWPVLVGGIGIFYLFFMTYVFLLSRGARSTNGFTVVDGDLMLDGEHVTDYKKRQLRRQQKLKQKQLQKRSRQY